MMRQTCAGVGCVGWGGQARETRGRYPVHSATSGPHALHDGDSSTSAFWAVPAERFSQTMRMLISAGDKPGKRGARPMVEGRIFLNFFPASNPKLGTIEKSKGSWINFSSL